VQLYYGFNLQWTHKSFDEILNIDEFIQQIDVEERENISLLKICNRIMFFINRSDLGIVELLLELFPGHFIFKDNSWICFDSNTKRWVNNVHPLKIVIMYEIEKHWRHLLKDYMLIKIQQIIHYTSILLRKWKIV
jgi:hypothetical protein